MNRKQGQLGWRILIAGTGGQGVLTAARLLCDGFVKREHTVVTGRLHGMAQRGGAVQSSVIIDGGVSPVIPRGQAGFVLGFEPVETARALPFMSPRTVVYMNTTPVIPYTVGQQAALGGTQERYPQMSELSESIRAVTPYVFAFDATGLAIEAGSARTLNMVMLGCLLGSGALPCSPAGFWDTIAGTMPTAWTEANARAFAKGVQSSKRLQCCEESCEAENRH